MITKEIIKDLYTKYSYSSGRDSWDISADIINDLVTREKYPSDAEYYYFIKTVWNMIQEYINSTYEHN